MTKVEKNDRNPSTMEHAFSEKEGVQKVPDPDRADAPEVIEEGLETADPAQAQAPTDVLSHVVGLMMQSPEHKHLFLTDLEWLVIPPLMLQQLRLFRKDGVAVGYASWAYLSDEAEARLKDGVRRMQPGDWRSGENLWLIDLVAPFGGGEAMASEIREKVLPGKTIKTFQPAPDGRGRAVVEW